MNPDPTLEAFIAELDAAASARDVERFLDLFVDGPDLAFAFAGQVMLDMGSIRAMHRASWSKLSGVKFTTTPRRVVTLSPDVVVLTASGLAERIDASGAVATRPYAVTLVLVRRKGRWRVLQAHESVPPPGPGSIQ